uniref:Alpha/beta hydrolase fold-3 domain-containing protein n=1 Tax=Aegilops tauschii TaxID=37682 RepID=N1R2B5_AEGTA
MKFGKREKAKSKMSQWWKRELCRPVRKGMRPSVESSGDASAIDELGNDGFCVADNLGDVHRKPHRVNFSRYRGLVIGALPVFLVAPLAAGINLADSDHGLSAATPSQSSLPPSATPAMDDPGFEIECEIPGVVRVHKSGRVVRLNGTETVPPSPSGDPANGVASKDVVLDPAANISARLYLPAATAAEPGKKLPVVVFFHGGAFMIYTAASPLYHNTPVPGRLRGRLRGPQEGAEHGLAGHGDASRVVLAGDSAGANMAHRTAVRLRKERIEGYGDKSRSAGSSRTPPSAAASTRDGLSPCGGKLGLDHPYINPAASPEELSQLGCDRVLVATAEHCWFVERSRAYAAGLKACGWGGELRFYETKGDGHVYFLLKPDCDNAAKELTVVADFVRRC